jgi:hypothetical protein
LGSEEIFGDLNVRFLGAETVGIGMRIPQSSGVSHNDVEVFVTRRGKLLYTWQPGTNSDSAMSSQLADLMGDKDIYAIVGAIDEATLEVRFKQSKWEFEP